MNKIRQPRPGALTPQPYTLRRFLIKQRTMVRKKLRLEHSVRELAPELAARQLHFHAPPLEPPLLETIRLISPQFHLRPTERSRRFWELNQNGLCWGEYDVLSPFLDRLGTPSRVLDIGAGLGRSAIFLKSIRDWDQVPFHLYDGTGTATRYTKAGPRFQDSFCGNLEVLEAVLRYNEVEQWQIFDAAQQDSALAHLPGPYDFIYSFFAVGFHWSIEHFLDELLELLTDRAIGAFTLHPRFDNLAALERVPHRIVEFNGSWPRGKRYRMLVLARSEAPLAAASR